ncbi:MAG TPA: tetratricopeptide repeat protein [Bacteroides sp.]|nr:tetratricopeptide repeat protein [Bacteroides sp.]
MDELKIIQYLDGEMTGKELEKFEEAVRMNPTLAEEVSRYREIQGLAMKLLSDQDTEMEKEISEAVEDYKRDPQSYGNIPEDYREKLMDAERELHRSGEQTGSILMIRRIWYSAAALVIIALAISVLVFKPFSTIPPGEVYAQYFSSFSRTDEIIEIARDDNDYIFATEVYEAGDYERAAALFELLADSSGLRSWSLFYAGSSYMLLNQTDKAIEYFQSALDEPGDEVISPAHWHLALCYLKQGMPEIAREHLILLSDDPVYRKDANRILKLLK